MMMMSEKKNKNWTNWKSNLFKLADVHWIRFFFLFSSFLLIICRLTLPNSISVDVRLIIWLEILMCGIIHNVCSWRRGVECVNRHAVLLILLLLTSLLTYLVRLHRKLIKLHMQNAQYGTFVFFLSFCLSTPWLKRLFIGIDSMISRLFSQLYSCWSINRCLLLLLLLRQWHDEDQVEWSSAFAKVEIEWPFLFLVDL